MLLSLLWLCASATATDSTTLELVTGDNLIGFGVLPADPTIDETLSGVSQDVTSIMGEHHFAYHDDGVWIRNFDHFEHTLGYSVNLALSEPTEVEIFGDSTDPDIRMQLHKGLNLVHFSCKEDVPVSEVIPDWASDAVSSITGHGVSATRVNETWGGSLTELRPNNGYWLTADRDLNDFAFVCPDGNGKSLHVYACIDPFASNYDDYATVDDGSCEYNVPVGWNPVPIETRAFFFLNDVRINGDAIDANHDPICVKQEQRCLGFGYTRDQWTGVTAYEGDPAAPLTFVVFDADANAEIELSIDSPPAFVDGEAVYGGCTNPDARNYSDIASFDIGNCIECDSDADCQASDDTCTPIRCQNRQCVAQPLDCDDSDPCTDDSCVEPDGCIHVDLALSECNGSINDSAVADATGCGCTLSSNRPTSLFLLLLLPFFYRKPTSRESRA